jgi:hypothetical protein
VWTTIQIVLGVIAILLVLGSDKLSMPILGTAGMVCFGLTAMAIGWEAILTRQLVLGRRRHRNVQTYSGIPAILQGVQFNLMGLFLIVIAIMVYFNANGRAVFLEMVRRPGLPLIGFGMLLLMQAVITLTGSHELRQGPRWIVIMNLLVSRLLPGTVLVLLGVGAVGVGLFEIVAPNVFDEMGGGFLEVLYGLR